MISMAAIKIAIVGVGKIVRDQHLPAIAKNDDFELIATASRNGTVDGVPAFTSIEEMLDAVPEIEIRRSRGFGPRRAAA